MGILLTIIIAFAVAAGYLIGRHILKNSSMCKKTEKEFQKHLEELGMTEENPYERKDDEKVK